MIKPIRVTNMNHRIVFLFFMLIIGSLLLTGCWSQKELTDLALVSAMGIDLDEKGKYVVTFQIVNPESVAAGKQGGGQSAPVSVFTVTGNNIVEASKKVTK